MSNNRVGNHIAYFISPHGFGHAARASAVMSAVHEADPSICFEIFTSVPSWFFEESLRGPYAYHFLETDVGLVQESPLHADLEKTVARLSQLIPYGNALIAGLAQEIKSLGCRVIVCDISPMGIAVAREVGLSSVLVENFTWDWVYEEYAERYGALKPYAEYFKGLFNDTDYHIQTEPVCSSKPGAFTVQPVSRAARSPREVVRHQLGIADHAKMVLVTMGGVPQPYDFLQRVSRVDNTVVVIPGGSDIFRSNGHLITLPHHSSFFHPDLINTADAVIGKVGYSTVAEVYHGGVPFGFIKRPDFRESDILATYIADHMSGLAIEEASLQTGDWMANVPKLLDMPCIQRRGPNGTQQITEFICGLV